jgi:hypothetical protein
MAMGPFERLISNIPPLTPVQLRDQRIELIKEIQAHRKRPLVIYATNINTTVPGVPAFIHRDDIVPLSEILGGIIGSEVDVMIETPGGLAEVTIEIVKLLRPRFSDVAFIVPHIAMSAGTILAMSGNEILMDHRSSLGAIDPQFLGADGRPQPAQALLAGIDAIKQEVAQNGGNLNPVYMPILRNVDPGKLQSALNASKLSRELVTEWLAAYKFQKWTTHSSNGQAVTDDERRQRASEIAHALCDHQSWLSHARPIKIAELEKMRLKITDYGKDPVLQDLVWRLWVNFHHLMQSTNLYKLFESETNAIGKVALQQPSIPSPPQQGAQQGKAHVEVRCNKCGSAHKVQFNFGVPQPPDPGCIALPKNCLITCASCGTAIDLKGLKLQLEAQLGQPIVF